MEEKKKQRFLKSLRKYVERNGKDATVILQEFEEKKTEKALERDRWVATLDEQSAQNFNEADRLLQRDREKNTRALITIWNEWATEVYRRKRMNARLKNSQIRDLTINDAKKFFGRDLLGADVVLSEFERDRYSEPLIALHVCFDRHLEIVEGFMRGQYTRNSITESINAFQESPQLEVRKQITGQRFFRNIQAVHIRTILDIRLERLIKKNKQMDGVKIDPECNEGIYLFASHKDFGTWWGKTLWTASMAEQVCVETFHLIWTYEESLRLLPVGFCHVIPNKLKVRPACLRNLEENEFHGDLRDEIIWQPSYWFLLYDHQETAHFVVSDPEEVMHYWLSQLPTPTEAQHKKSYAYNKKELKKRSKPFLTSVMVTLYQVEEPATENNVAYKWELWTPKIPALMERFVICVRFFIDGEWKLLRSAEGFVRNEAKELYLRHAMLFYGLGKMWATHTLLTNAVQTRNIKCAHCGSDKQQSLTGSLHSCSGCKLVKYCSSRCQKASWKNWHKLACPVFKQCCEHEKCFNFICTQEFYNMYAVD